jgi:predicted nucleic acid-binding protein
METKVFLDTNIIIDYLLETRHKHLLAKDIISHCYNGSLNGCISETVITNTAYIVRKMLNQAQLNFVFGGFCSFLDVLGISSPLVIKACNANFNDLEDAILYQIALENECQYFITTNTKDFISISQSQLKVVTPEEFLEIFTMP